MAEALAGANGCRALRFDTDQLRALIVGSAKIGEIIMRAFLLRRTALIAEGANTPLAGRPDAGAAAGFSHPQQPSAFIARRGRRRRRSGTGRAIP